MELWIRSQDKETLVKANALYVMDNQIWNEVPFYENHKKIGLTITGHNHKLAQYKTKERALEVLDEIQNILKPQLLVRRNDDNDKELLGALQKGVTQKLDMEFKELSTYVYEMPKEE